MVVSPAPGRARLALVAKARTPTPEAVWDAWHTAHPHPGGVVGALKALVEWHCAHAAAGFGPGDPKPEPKDLRTVLRLGAEIEKAIEVGDWEQLTAALQTWPSFPRSVMGRRLLVVRAAKRALALWKKQDKADAVEALLELVKVVPEFTKLGREQANSVLRTMRSNGTELNLAAKLSVAIGAFNDRRVLIATEAFRKSTNPT